MSYVKKEWKIKDFQKGDLEFVNSLNHMEDGIASAGPGGEPAEYIKKAEVDGNKLTLTKKDDSQVIFEPQGGSEPTSYIKDAAVQDEKLTLTKKDGSLVELDVSTKAAQTDLDSEKDARVSGDEALQVAIDTKLAKPVEPVVGEGINVPYYFDVEYHETDAIVRDYTIDLLDNTKAPQQFALRITAASAQQAGLLQAGDKLKLDTLNQVEANPTLIGEEQELTGIQIGENKYKVPTGGSGEPASYIKDASIQDEKLTLTKKDGSLVELDVSAKANQTDLDLEKNARVLADEALQESIGLKQDKLTAGTNITIDENNVISATTSGGNVDSITVGGEKLLPYQKDIKIVLGNSLVYNDQEPGLGYKNLHVNFKSTHGLEVDGTNGLKVKVNKDSGTISLDANGLKVADNKFVKVPIEPVTGQGVNIPYYFDVNYAADKVTVKDYTIDLLDTSIAPKQFALDINGATSTSAGLMTADEFNKVENIEALIPSQASTTNQLADKDFVNSTVQTSTATFRGNFATKADLDAYAGEKKANDYAVVQADETHSNQSWRYKYDGSEWKAEYKLNDTAFTAKQWAAINSEVTSEKVSNYDTHIANVDIHVTADQKNTWDAKQDAISDIADIRAKANSAVQPAAISGMATETWVKNQGYLTQHQDISGKLDKPAEPVAGQGINIPYFFDVSYSTDKAIVKDYTIDLLDNSKAPQQFSININSATQSTAGLMSATDKIALDNKQDKLTAGTNITIDADNKISAAEQLPAYPTDTDAEYVLAIKYENNTWVKYWKEIANKSDIVDKGIVDYMVLKQ